MSLTVVPLAVKSGRQCNVRQQCEWVGGYGSAAMGRRAVNVGGYGSAPVTPIPYKHTLPSKTVETSQTEDDDTSVTVV